jgi:hypothetical protein
MSVRRDVVCVAPYTGSMRYFAYASHMHLTRTICCKLAMDDQDLYTLAATQRA